MLGLGLAEGVAEAGAQRANVRSSAHTSSGPPLTRVEPADVVEAHDVVGVGVGVDDGVDAVDAVGDALEPQLRRRVDEDARVAVAR